MKPRLLIVDDDESIRTQMKWALTDDYEVTLAEDRAEAVQRFQAACFDAVLLDLGLPPHPNETVEGMQTLGQIRAIDPLAKIIIISGQNDRSNALQAIADGAYDFMCKPIDTEELQVILKRACYVRHVEREYHDLQERQAEGDFENMLGSSPEIQQVFASIRKVAGTEAPLLILGESGTGKEMTALATHRRSLRSEGPFVAINCGAIPEPLLESELFGHEKGSFTGAHAQRQGRIETAAGGTLFLDEIGELPSALQVKLLRFLQERNLQRVGGRKDISVDTRVIAATNRDLQVQMKDGNFREDLFYRLAVVTIDLPALRDRTGDIQLLARSFLQRFSQDAKSGAREFSPAAVSAIESYPWPGNIRELENKVRRAVIMAEGKQVMPEDLELSGLQQSQQVPTLREARETLERELVQRALAKNNGKISQSARDLGVSRPTFYELMSKLGIER